MSRLARFRRGGQSMNGPVGFVIVKAVTARPDLVSNGTSGRSNGSKVERFTMQLD
jgi:hypothetical protein